MAASGVFELSRQALLVIDLQNAFCHPDGSFSRMGYDLAGCRAAVPGSLRLVEAARACGVKVFFVTYAYAADYSDGGFLVDRIHPQVVRHHALAKGTWDVQLIDEFTPRADERRVVKNRYSAFVGTDLADVLSALAINAVTLCGVTTNVCVESTARDAAQLDFAVTVVEDATGELDEARHDASLVTIRHAFGRVIKADVVCEEWRSLASINQRV